VSAAFAGFVAVLVGFTSTGILVFSAAHAVGADAAQTASWLLAICIGAGISSMALSLRYRIPVTAAWSTPGAALIVANGGGITLAEAVGAFLVSGSLIALAGFSGAFERLLSRLPLSLAAATLAGVLLRFGLGAFATFSQNFALAAAMFGVYLVARNVFPRFAVLVALLVGMAVSIGQGTLTFAAPLAAASPFAWPLFTVPHFTWNAFFGIAIPLFAVNMASQNVPGVAALRAHGYHPPVSSVVGWTGVANAFVAPFGGFAVNLAAITASICAGREAHDDPARRYIASWSAGVCYLLLGAFGASFVAFFSAFPKDLVALLAGLALLGAIGGGLTSALAVEKDREAAVVTLLVAASGVSLAGVGSAFWGIVAGALVLAIGRGVRWLKRPRVVPPATP